MTNPITITLQTIRDHNPCADGFAKAVKAHGPDYDSPFPVSALLDSNGLDDTMWALRCLPQHDALWRKYAVWCARQVQHLMNDPRSLKALDVAWAHSEGLASDGELRDAARAAYAAYAASYAAADAAYADAARAAFYAANAAAALAAAAADADAAAAARAAADAAQAEKLRSILDAGEWVE